MSFILLCVVSEGDGRWKTDHLPSKIFSFVNNFKETVLTSPHQSCCCTHTFCLGLMKLKRYQHFKQNVHDHAIKQNEHLMFAACFLRSEIYGRTYAVNIENICLLRDA